MASSLPIAAPSARPSAAAILELLKPITWFAPMWAFGCGVVSSGQSIAENWLVAALGVALAGPLVCGTSQAVNDWFDRHVDAINEPERPIPSGRVPGRWGLYIACAWTAFSLAVAGTLGPWVFGAAVLGLALAWAYSAPPFRLKLNGWWGNAAVALSYEGLAWFTGAAVMISTLPDWRIILMAALYSLGAHGIMTLNDFKSVDGDRQMGIRSLPVQLGVNRAARLACWVMALPQVVAIAALAAWGLPYHAAIVAGLLTVQVLLMVRLIADPRGRAPWYNATGTTLYVLGMLASAFALAGL
jgi:chlorophyll synthase